MPSASGTVFRVWAPGARRVHLRDNAGPTWRADASNALVAGVDGYWSGFAPGVTDGDAYRF